MSVFIQIDVSNLDTGLPGLTAALTDRRAMHAKIAEDAEKFTKDFGARKAAGEHRTAGALGARPTGHLERAYAGIQQESDDTEARLLVPRASRLRAAFGAYELKPRKRYLTIPVARDSYGRRAGEFDDLTFLRVGPRKTAILARKDSSGNLQTMYLLVTSARIPADESLLPFDQLGAVARDSAEEHLDNIIREGLA